MSYLDSMGDYVKRNGTKLADNFIGFDVFEFKQYRCWVDSDGKIIDVYRWR